MKAEEWRRETTGEKRSRSDCVERAVSGCAGWMDSSIRDHAPGDRCSARPRELQRREDNWIWRNARLSLLSNHRISLRENHRHGMQGQEKKKGLHDDHGKGEGWSPSQRGTPAPLDSQPKRSNSTSRTLEWDAARGIERPHQHDEPALTEWSCSSAFCHDATCLQTKGQREKAQRRRDPAH